MAYNTHSNTIHTVKSKSTSHICLGKVFSASHTVYYYMLLCTHIIAYTWSSCEDVTGLPHTSSILRYDCDIILVAGTEVVWCEDTECLRDIDAVSIWHRHCSLICHIVDEDRVPDIRINTCHIQREWSSP